MKRNLGFAMFFMGIGIFLTLFLPEENVFIRILLSAVLIVCGYECCFLC